VVHAPVIDRYYVQGRVDLTDTDGRWTLPDVHIGSDDPAEAGNTFEVFALVTDDTLDSRLQNLDGAESDGGYSSTAWKEWLSPFVIDRASVVRCPSTRDASRCD
jgi:hypothetical protein